MEDKIVCPRCKGCGTVKKIRKRVISPDPTKKWCNLCKNFLDRVKFYNDTGYCKICHNSKYNPLLRKKYTKKCIACGKEYLGYRKGQKYCSRRCNCDVMNKKHALSGYKSLSNEQMNELNEEIEYKY